MDYELVADGHPESNGMALVCHNERLADPLDSITRAISAISKKRNKTMTDHEEIARLEWYGGLYTTSPIEAVDGEVVIPSDAVPTVPAWNLIRCLQDGGKRHKRGVDVPKGVHPLTEHATLEYDGPSDPTELWATGNFMLRKTVGVQRARTTRTRPMFHPWTATLAIEVDPVIFDLDTLEKLWSDAGRYSGLGEMRPVYGRFNGTIRERVTA
jgi:hypothetical protein